jgi:D-glycero-alpha-D-manno-heptose 1-phosphate guanylyltransferase
MTAIILAGGLGTRLRSVINDLPKCMAPINGVPFLSYILKKLSLSGFKKVILAVGYLKNLIIDYYGFNFENIIIQYSIEDEPLGTGGAILKASNLVNDDYYFVLNGDTYFDLDFELMFKNKSNFLIASKKMHDVSRYGSLEIESNIIKAFCEKGRTGIGFINGGVYLIRKFFLNSFSLPIKFSFEKDFLEKKVKLLQFRTLSSDNLFIDIGVPNDFDLAQSLLKYE